MNGFSIKVDVRALMGLKKKFQFSQGQLEKILEVIKEDIKHTTPVDTGKLKSGIVKKVISNTKGEIYIRGKRNNEVAKFLIEGTKDHFIAPRRAKALRFFVGGKAVFSGGHMVTGIPKGYWDFEPSIRAMAKVKTLIRAFIRVNG